MTTPDAPGSPVVLPYGSWPSPLSAAAVSAGSPRLEGARFVGGTAAGPETWWGESVADEGGRSAVRRRAASGTVVDVLPAPWSARPRVHEYGGGSWTADDAGTLYFVEKTDQRVWRLDPDSEPRPLTPDAGDVRYGGLTLQGGRLLAVREDHTAGAVPARDIVEIPLEGAAAADPARVASLAAGSDFVAHPALSPDGTRLAWIAWNRPDMAWDRAELRVGPLEGGRVSEWTVVAGGEGLRRAPLQPEWVGDDELVYADDPSGRWNLWALGPVDGGAPEALAPADADTGGALWVLGTRWFAALGDGRIVAVRTNGAERLVTIDPAGEVRDLEVEPVTRLSIEDVRGSRLLLAGAGASGAGLWEIDVDRPDAGRLVVGASSPWGDEWMPRSRAVTVPGLHGPVHAFDYPPTNPHAVAPAGELPPYVVFVHGGPTDHVGGAASGKIAYLTSRGIGVLDVNYGGSSGYGRAYRERLLGQWGVVDVDDVVAAARGLAAAGVADARRLAIAGGSAGGWTVLCALTDTDAFAAGISRYGVADLRRLAEDTHDFEAGYLDGLVGPLPEAEALYVERSPLSRLERMQTPLLIEQGLDDQVVPPAQSEAVRDALAANGVAHAYLAFEGEGHGFRGAATLVRTMEAELAFLGRVLGFETPGVPPLELA
ncbi:prolyl oligopeptidase family serine peptidase [Microbacterium sp. M3]|uniref:Prolyl oligopeptidase family serine peptidase n=1 Tax=Microbacterium arthrosphaerae TaxID=792652 RepID=A0ABU4H198_9MICO|nr:MULTISPECIES: prolyl oligopeptidase family serine peptidase [Microbacterium]MDW4573091.1 prolyl oligopeptidase family serine peptidase [Microbacterium arthrosphaerae]MDW7606946.1 prolyl oligopeptidase family serine peptidase [Microbacterium sp. M3]